MNFSEHCIQNHQRCIKEIKNTNPNLSFTINSTLYTTLPHHIIKYKPIDLIELNERFLESTHFIWLVTKDVLFSLLKSDVNKSYKLWSCKNICEALVYHLDDIFIRFGNKLYRQIVGIPMETNCAPLVVDLFLSCYERDFMKSLSRENQADIIEAFNSTSRYLDDLCIKF